MYISSEALRLFAKSKKPAFTAEEAAVMANYKKKLDLATKFIPPGSRLRWRLRWG
jgi:PiT family inorganic phosphate transporter